MIITCILYICASKISGNSSLFTNYFVQISGFYLAFLSNLATKTETFISKKTLRDRSQQPLQRLVVHIPVARAHICWSPYFCWWETIQVMEASSLRHAVAQPQQHGQRALRGRTKALPAVAHPRPRLTDARAARCGLPHLAPFHLMGPASSLFPPTLPNP